MRSFLLIILFFSFLSFDAMAAVVTKTIGTTSRDYSTITAWKDDLNDDGIYADGDTAVGEIYNDSVFNENVSFNTGLNIGGVGDKLALIRLTVPESERHDGTAGTGARTVGTGLNGSLKTETTVNHPSLIIEWYEVNSNGNTGGGGSAGLHNFPGGSNLHNKIIRNNIFHNAVLNTSPGYILRAGTRGQTHHVMNNIVYKFVRNANFSSHVGLISVDVLFSSGTIHVYNNTAHNVKYNGTETANAICYNYGSDVSNIKWKNNIGTDSGGTSPGNKDNFRTGITNIESNNNLSEDLTAPGTGSVTSEDPADLYVSTTLGSEDLHLKSGAGAIGAGADLSSVGNAVEIDIDGDDRTGLTWDIGADQFIGVAPPGRRRIMKLL